MEECRLQLLGPPQLSSKVHDGPLSLRKAVALAAFLAVERREFSREYLATLLWPDHGQQSALANLRRTLSVLRREFADGCLVSEGDQVRLDESNIAVDVDEFRRFLAAHTPGGDPSPLLEAYGLYRGSFMEGFTLPDCEEYDRWQSAVRDRLQGEMDALLEHTCRAYLEAGDAGNALRFAQKALELDPWNEIAHRSLMEIYGRTGRSHAARTHYEALARALREEGLEPDAPTTELYDRIGRNGLSPATRAVTSSLPAEAATPPTSRRSWKLRWYLVPAALLVVAACVAVVALTHTTPELRVESVSVMRGSQAGLTVRAELVNEGRRVRRAPLRVVFSSVGADGLVRHYTVYERKVFLEGGGAVTRFEVPLQPDIQTFVDFHGLDISPGSYTLSVILDPENEIAEGTEVDNMRMSSEWFYYSGSTPLETFDIEISYGGTEPLDGANPIKVFIGDRSLGGEESSWAWYKVIRDGRHYLPLADIERRDGDESGYYLIIVHDVGDDLRSRHDSDPRDVTALYKETEGNLVYGSFSLAGATPVYPGRSYHVRFSPPPPPEPDQYETDDRFELGTVIASAGEPIRQLHTFHSDGTGDVDVDWFQVAVAAGATVTIETFAAGGVWECNTQIDVNERENYLGSTRGKAHDDGYSSYTYTNRADDDTVITAAIRPVDRYQHPSFMVGEYAVEYRWE